jgi:hypothetical protein
LTIYDKLQHNVIFYGQTTWLSTLTTKFKYERGKLSDVPLVRDKRLKFGRSTPRAIAASVLTEATRCHRVEV